MNKKSDFLTEISKNKYFSNLPSFKEKKTQEVTTIMLTFITISLFAIFAISPTLSTIAQLKRELADNQEVDRTLELKIKNLGLLQQQYTTLQGDIPFIFSAIPQTPEGTLLTGQLQAVAQKSNVSIVRSQIFQVDLPKQTNNTEKTSTSFAFSATAVGSYQNIINFMKQLSSFERIISIDSLAISNGPEGSGTIQLNLRGKAYFKP